jgi:hypothetical protein
MALQNIDQDHILFTVNNVNLQNYLLQLREIYSNFEVDIALSLIHMSIAPTQTNYINAYEPFNNNNNNNVIQNNIIYNDIIHNDMIQNNIYENEEHVASGLEQFPYEMRLDQPIQIDLKLSLDQRTEPEIELECPVCYCDHVKNSTVLTNCNHSFCKECIKMHIVTFKNRSLVPTCPMCRSNISTLSCDNDMLHGEFSEFLSSI